VPTTFAHQVVYEKKFGSGAKKWKAIVQSRVEAIAKFGPTKQEAKALAMASFREAERQYNVRQKDAWEKRHRA